MRPDGSIAVLDFDDCMLGWPVQDLGITVFELVGRADFERLGHALGGVRAGRPLGRNACPARYGSSPPTAA